MRNHKSDSWSMDYLRTPVLPERLTLLCPGLFIMLASSRHLPGKSYWVTHHHMRQACLQREQIQPMLKIARIHEPLPVDCLFPSHKGFGSLASSPVANSTQLNTTTSLLSMLGH